jgi:hypothetical protein
LKEWKKQWDGPTFSYEYHFWTHQYRDPSGLYIAQRIYEDIRGLQYIGLDGYVEDGTQRTFFPNGLVAYVYAETLVNRDIHFEDIVEDYYSHVYGEDWKQVLEYMQNIQEAFEFRFMEGEGSKDVEISKYYAPSKEQGFRDVKKYTQQCRELVRAHLSMPTRPQTVSWRLLEKHAEFCEGLAEFMAEKCQGHEELAEELAEAFFDKFGKYEVEIERYYDHFMAKKSLIRIVKTKKKPVLQAGLEG